MVADGGAAAACGQPDAAALEERYATVSGTPHRPVHPRRRDGTASHPTSRGRGTTEAVLQQNGSDDSAKSLLSTPSSEFGMHPVS